MRRAEFKDMNRPIKTCRSGSCKDCDISLRTNCYFNSCQLLEFYVISSPSFILGGIGIYSNSPTSFFIWLLIIILFFFVIEIRVLCSHCPHYENSKMLLKCWANSGAPKLWRFRPWPMNIFEKSILITGFSIVWGYPLVFFLLTKSWWYSIFYSLLTVAFFILLSLRNCVKCINFSCPLNRVGNDTKNRFTENNPVFNHTENLKTQLTSKR